LLQLRETGAAPPACLRVVCSCLPSQGGKRGSTRSNGFRFFPARNLMSMRVQVWPQIHLVPRRLARRPFKRRLRHRAPQLPNRFRNPLYPNRRGLRKTHDPLPPCGRVGPLAMPCRQTQTSPR